MESIIEIVDITVTSRMSSPNSNQDLRMNILHYVTKKQEVSPKLQKLKASCDAACGDSLDEEARPVSEALAPALSKEELEKRLSPIEYRVTQQKGTEKPNSGKYVHWKEEGVFNCVVCGNPLFSSESKYDSGSGWPAFTDVLSKDRVLLENENIGGLQRMEVKCRECRSHLGHVFDDGPRPTGVRYCVNSCSLDFRKHTTV